MKDNKLIVIDYMRFVAILSIVMWHCAICPYLSWNLLDINTLPINYPVRILAIVFFPDATMPLFTFISGYLFSYLIGLGKYGVFRDFALNKINRLIVPFLVIGTMVNLTSYDRYLMDIPWGEGSHLWYCCMLFWCFIITWIVVKCFHSSSLYILFMASFLLQLSVENHFEMGFKLPLGIHHSFYYIGYFVAGCLLFNNKKIVEWLNSYKKTLVILYLAICIVPLFNIHPFIRLSLVVHNYLYSILLLVLLGTLEIRSPLVANIVSKVCRFSFGIYVFHEWISWNFCHIPVITDFLRIHYILFPIMNSICIFILSFVITEVFLKTKIGRYLLL